MNSGDGRTDDIVLPRYGEAALTDVLPSVRSALQGGPGNVLHLPSADCYVVFLIDALGWNLLHRHRADAPYLSSLLDAGRALTSGVPSTTSASLVGLGTGLPPGKHGVVGYTMAIPGRPGKVLNTLKWDGALPPQEWQPYETELQRALLSGITVTSVAKKSFQGSGLTVAGLRGGVYAAADSAGQRVDRTVQGCSGRRPALVYTYDGDLDWTGHRDGCDSAAFRHQLAATDASLSRLRSALPSGTVLLVTGDHGMIDVPFTARVDVDSSPELRMGVRMVAGDARLRYLYTLAGVPPSEVVDRWRARLGDQALVLTREEAIDAGWFGSVDSHVRPRIGDVIIAALDTIAIQCEAQFPAEKSLLGWHGSLTPDEMYVPLLLDQVR